MNMGLMLLGFVLIGGAFLLLSFNKDASVTPGPPEEKKPEEEKDSEDHEELTAPDTILPAQSDFLELGLTPIQEDITPEIYVAAKLPKGIRYARNINFINIGFLTLFLLFLWLFLLPRSLSSACTTPAFWLPIVFVLLIVNIGFIGFLIWVNHGLLNCSPSARKQQIGISIFLGIFGFPISTILYGICLYYFFNDADTLKAFERGTRIVSKKGL